MHRALQLEEILSAIFIYFAGTLGDIDPSTLDPADFKDCKTLAALARTCRVFQEPALDALWMVMPTLLPLAWNLPQLDSVSLEFSRPLTQTDWDTFRGYARRIQAIHGFDWSDRHWKYFQLLSDPPTDGTLFPKLRHLNCRYNALTMHLLDRPLPSLVYLYVQFQTFPSSLKSFPKFSPNITKISVCFDDERYGPGNMDLDCLCRWQNLSSVDLSYLALTTEDLVRLSRMPALIDLSFSPGPYSNLPLLSFANLQRITLECKALYSILQSLLQIRLPAITECRTYIRDCPSRRELAAFFSGLLTSNAPRTITLFELSQWSGRGRAAPPEELVLRLEDLQCYMDFHHLTRLDLSFEHTTVTLTADDLLTLGSAWPRLEHLRIRSRQGWSSGCGITPDGLVRLWQTCRSLRHIELLLDTRGYTEVPSSEALARLPTLPPTVTINVLDAAIEADAVCAITAFFTGIATRCQLWLQFWSGEPRDRTPREEEYVGRWNEVRARVYGPHVYRTSEW